MEGVPEPLFFLGALLGAQSPKEGSGTYVPSVVLTYTLTRLPLALLLRRLLGLQLALHLADFSAGLPLPAYLLKRVHIGVDFGVVGRRMLPQGTDY